MSYEVTYWQNCYDLNWKGVIVDPAFSHPAKFAHGLIKRIYQHALSTGLIEPGGVVVDPFGGVALGGLYAMQNGLHWIGCELEEKFVDLGRENIALWNERYAAHFANRGTAQLLQGDSRRLADVIGAAGIVVCSPPYADQETPDWSKRELSNNKEYDRSRPTTARSYGSSPGQLGAMKPGDPSAVICSPPFAGNSGGRGEASRNGIDSALFDRHSGGMKGGTGTNPANLDHLKMGTLAAVVGSPPFAESIGSDDPAKRGGLFRDPRRAGDVNLTGSYGNTPGQLGAESTETFWAAAKTIIDQCYQILPEHGAAIWVTKRYVKAGAIVDFSQQWASLCEANGFEVVEWIRAMLIKNDGTVQSGLDGGVTSKSVKRASFFRRLHEKKRPDLAIDWEDVIIMRKV